ncbi:hypothetical protein BJX61DRAFT_472021 [Aspergillus egyptiacus]|nr:hypothetical protein BJX61DRAFT_472021 [Aspergillus egyptiacus]
MTSRQTAPPTFGMTSFPSSTYYYYYPSSRPAGYLNWASQPSPYQALTPWVSYSSPSYPYPTSSAVTSATPLIAGQRSYCNSSHSYCQPHTATLLPSYPSGQKSYRNSPCSSTSNTAVPAATSPKDQPCLPSIPCSVTLPTTTAPAVESLDTCTQTSNFTPGHAIEAPNVERSVKLEEQERTGVISQDALAHPEHADETDRASTQV